MRWEHGFFYSDLIAQISWRIETRSTYVRKCLFRTVIKSPLSKNLVSMGIKNTRTVLLHEFCLFFTSWWVWRAKYSGFVTMKVSRYLSLYQQLWSQWIETIIAFCRCSSYRTIRPIFVISPFTSNRMEDALPNDHGTMISNVIVIMHSASCQHSIIWIQEYFGLPIVYRLYWYGRNRSDVT